MEGTYGQAAGLGAEPRQQAAEALHEAARARSASLDG